MADLYLEMSLTMGAVTGEINNLTGASILVGPDVIHMQTNMILYS